MVNPNSSCGKCHYCFKGKPHYCPTGGIRSTIGLWRNGGWANFCRVPAAQVFPIPTQITLQAAVLVEPMSCILRGWDQLMPLPTDADILICGTGIIGLLFACLAHFSGYRRVVLSEVSEKRRSLASGLKLGYSVVHPDELDGVFKRAISKNEQSWGFDAIIDCTGAPKAIEQAFKWTRYGAIFVLFGCCPKNSQITLNPLDIAMKELKIIGSLINPFTFPRAIQVVQDMAEKYLNYDKIGVQLFKLENYMQALASLRKGQIAKAVFEI